MGFLISSVATVLAERRAELTYWAPSEIVSLAACADFTLQKFTAFHSWLLIELVINEGK